MAHQIAVDSIIAKTTGGKILIESLETYKQAYVLADLDDNDHVPKRVLIEAIDSITPGGVNVLEFAVLAGSPIPYNLDLTGSNFQNGLFTKVELSLSASKSRQVYDIPIDSIYDVDTGLITSVDIYGHDSGDGATTQDDLIITLYSIA